MRRFAVLVLAMGAALTISGCMSKGVVSPSPGVAEPPAKEESRATEPTPQPAPRDEEAMPADAEPLGEETSEKVPVVEPAAGTCPMPRSARELVPVRAEDGGRYAEFMLEGRARYEAGDFRGAATSFLQAVGLRPTSSAAHYNLAKAYEAGGESAALVIYELERAAAGEPALAEALPALGVAYFRERRFKDAEGVFGRALAQELTAENLSNLGAARYKLDQKEKAKAAFEEALELDPDRPECFWYLAKIATQEGDVEAAKRYWRKAIEAYGSASEWGKKGIEELKRLEGAPGSD